MLDLAARVVELEAELGQCNQDNGDWTYENQLLKAENARLREGVLIIKRSWDWWNEDRHDRCSSAVSDAIDAALKGGA